MREILFRGQAADTKEWVYGSLINNAFCTSVSKLPIPYILDINKIGNYDCWEDISENLDDLEVFPKTIGQYTGLQDKNGDKIFEGDILKANMFGTNVIGSVSYSNGAFYLANSCMSDNQLFILSDIEIIGNIHDNPKLLGD